MKKIFIARKADKAMFKTLIDLGYQIDISNNELTNSNELKEAFKNYDAVITTIGCDINKDIIKEAGEHLKIIATASVGFDHIDIETCKAKNIYVTNTPGANSWCVAEHTVGLILDATHRISEADRFVRKDAFHGFDFNLFIGDEIKDNIIGIVGLGDIGKAVAKILVNGFGCKVYYYDCKRDEKFEKDYGVTFVAELEDLIKASDILTIHVPLQNDTKYLIHEYNLNLMKSNAYLINTSRGAVVKEQALIDVLKNNKIRGAAMDVFEDEINVNKEFMTMNNVVLTPHIAASSDETHENMVKVAMKNVIQALENVKPDNVVY